MLADRASRASNVAKAPPKFLKGKESPKFPAKKPGLSGDKPKARKAFQPKKKGK